MALEMLLPIIKYINFGVRDLTGGEVTKEVSYVIVTLV